MNAHDDDEQLIRQSLAGDGDATAEIVRRHRPTVHRHLCRYPLSPVERASLTDDTMRDIVKTIDASTGPFTSWMYRVTARRALLHLRARRAA